MTESMKDIVLPITDTARDKLFTKWHARNPVECKRSTAPNSISLTKGHDYSIPESKNTRRYKGVCSPRRSECRD